ncbi:hypothetical protein Q8W71_06850 [Methylobacterium sp. NEAU 140]|uniref:hypothetical protein n=1 Tax=Methylobacterium sp. NEAU 140 TaxID=3064945 RepID=UPI002732FDA9|nr:hypothetical protein [Methylobacterium sp. NEAU 140]MDP4022335.1 hypothetical protein [Methylobacterium sp. NEAU 140]
MADVEWLKSLIERTPVLVVDLVKAEAEGDTAALRYHGAVLAWQQEAALALSPAEQAAPADVKGRPVRTQGDRRGGPVVEPPSELVSTRDFPQGLAL